MLAQRCMGWHLTTVGKIPFEPAHRHEQCLLLYKEKNDGGGKRTNVQERPVDGAAATKRSGLPSGTRRRVHWYGETWIAHGGVGGAKYIFTVFQQDLETMEAEPPDPTAHDAGGTFRSFADDLFIKDVLPDHTADSVILNNAASLDNTLA